MMYSLLLALGLFSFGSDAAKKNTVPETSSTITFQDGRKGNMAVVEFKNQLFCRAEMPQDFEFDVHFSVVSVDVYFTGANFHGIEKRTIKSNSLKPLKDLMDRCTSGSVVTFDAVKVLGPDNEVRGIPGVTYVLF